MVSRPFLKWPGGKRWLVQHVREILKGFSYVRYIEPFLGAGAMFFGLRPPKALLSDKNADLINVYVQVQRDPEFLVEQLKALPVDEATYLRLRSLKPTDPVEAAVRFLYLNRTAFAGMYRLNRRGEFNVPFGGGQRTPTPLWTDSLLVTAKAALSIATVSACDFEQQLALAGLGDVVYCDPTYTVAHNNNGFVRYNERNFSWADHERLARACANAVERGALVIVSNAYHDGVRALYPTAEGRIVDRWSGLPPLADKRQHTKEFLFVLGAKPAATAQSNSQSVSPGNYRPRPHNMMRSQPPNTVTPRACRSSHDA